MNDQAMKFRLGVFVLGAAILLAILIILFGQFPTVFSSLIHYDIVMSSAPGVEPGTPVRKSGVKIGEVQSVDLQPDTGEVTVRIVVEHKYALRKGDQAQLGRGLILDEATINIVPEGGDRTPAPENYVFKGQVPEDIAKTLSKATDLLPLTHSTLDEIRALTKTVKEAMPEVRRTNAEVQVAAAQFGQASEAVSNFMRGNNERLSKAVESFADATARAAKVLDEDNQKNIAATLQNVRAASGRLEGLMKETELLVAETQKTVKMVGDRVDSVGKNTDELVTETRKTVKAAGDRVESVGKSAEELIVETKKTVKAVGDRVDSVGRGAEDLVMESRKTVKLVGERVDSSSRNADELLKEGRVTVQRVNNTLARTDEVLANLQVATKPLAEKAPAVMQNLEESTARLNTITYHVGEFSKAMNQSDGTFRKLLTDPSLYNNVNAAAVAASRAGVRLDKIMRDLELFADKIARHPELLGVSGAVSPSSGIKR